MGHAQITYVQYGEETTQPLWHHDSTTANWDSNLTEAEEALCADLYRSFKGVVDADTGEKLRDAALWRESPDIEVSPRCAESPPGSPAGRENAL
jgi:hypothetical protein